MQILFLPCAAGAESFLAEEVNRLVQAAGTPASVQSMRGGCSVHVPPERAVELVMRLNIGSRLAQRVLWMLSSAPYANEDELYRQAMRLPWADWINDRQTLKVDVTAQHSPLRSLNFAALRIKDAVCDVVRERLGARPSVDTHRPDVAIVLHLDERQARIYIDTSGAPLFKRGWREDKGEAPLKETLAAALLAAAGWQGRAEDGPLLDPCCGSGTIAIEAAQLACGIAPGLHRRFAFEKMLPFREHLPLLQRIRSQAHNQVHAPQVAIHASDVAFRLTDFAKRNAERAGVAHAIEFKTADVLQRPAPAAAGTIIMNPPYGERIEAKGSMRGGSRSAPPDAPRTQASRDSLSQDFYAKLAAHWKTHFCGWTAWVLSPDMKLPSSMRLKESRRVPMWNGPIECRMFRFDMVAGSARGAKASAARDHGDA